MSCINVHVYALTDKRFTRLASLLGLADGDHARGKVEHLWMACTLRGEIELPQWLVEEHLGEHGPDALVESELARWSRGRGDSKTRRLYLRGAEGRTEWYQRNSEQSSKGGKARARNASRVAGKFASQVAGDITSAKSKSESKENTEGAAGATPDSPGLDELKQKTRAAVEARAAKIPERGWKCADYLRAQILAEDPKAAVGRKPWGDEVREGLRLEWADTIRLLVERDHRTYEEIADVLRFVFHEQTGKARFIVQSADSLRDKFENILAVMKGQRAPAKPSAKPTQIPLAPSILRKAGGSQ